MSLIGSPIQNSLVQAAHAQEQAAKARDRTRTVTEEARRFQDTVDLKVAGVETPDALRPVSNDPDQSDERRQSDQQPQPRLEDQTDQSQRLDVKG